MKKAANLIIQRTCGISVLLATLLLAGCGGGGGGDRWENNRIDPYSGPKDYSYYDSSKSDIRNLTSPDETYSKSTNNCYLEVSGIPVDNSKDAYYTVCVTNPSRMDIDSLEMIPPGFNSNTRASISESEKDSSFQASCLSLLSNQRDNPFEKARLEEELKRVYQQHESQSAKSSTRASISHTNEKLGDIAIIPVLNKNRRCKLAKISDYAKFFVDIEQDNSVNPASMTADILDGFANEFDKYILPIIRDNFGNGSEICWKDVDQDEKLSIVFSPAVNNYGQNIAGIFESSDMNHSLYSRDVISIAVSKNGALPGSEDYDKWYMDARETIIHEMQHIVNYSAKGSLNEDLWINEGLSVCAEILYRKKRAESGLTTYSTLKDGECLDFAGNDARLYFAAYYNPTISLFEFPVSSQVSGDIYNAFAHYGQKGMFFYYIYEQYGSNAIKSLCQGEKGQEKFKKIATDRNIRQLFIDFNIAQLNEKHRNVVFTTRDNPFYYAKPQHKFEENMDLNYLLLSDGKSYRMSTENDLNSKVIDITQNQIWELCSPQIKNNALPANGGTARYVIKQPADYEQRYGQRSFTLSFQSSVPGLVINMVRMNP